MEILASSVKSQMLVLLCRSDQQKVTRSIHYIRLLYIHVFSAHCCHVALTFIRVDSVTQLTTRCRQASHWEAMGDVGSARYEPALLSPCPTITVFINRGKPTVHRGWLIETIIRVQLARILLTSCITYQRY